MKTRAGNSVVNGASVIGLVYEDGVMIAADNLLSYGYTARFPNCQRVFKVNKDTIVGAGGDYADFQHVWKYIEQKQIEDESMMDEKNSSPRSLHTWLTRVHYNKRCNFNPYWVEWVVGGIQNGQPFLGYVDKLGTSYQDKVVATGNLSALALPLLTGFTKNFTTKLNEEQARQILIKSLEILFYRDCTASSSYYLGVISKGKDPKIEGPFELKTSWEVALETGKSKVN